jgi:steroid delta-isomerase-like uncharacterized protein
MAHAPTETGTAEVARAYFTAIGERDREAQMKWYAPDGRGRMSGLLAEPTPREQVREFFIELFDAFPDFAFEVLDLVADGDIAVVRWHATGTFSGPGGFQGLAPNGRSLDVEGIDMVWVREGKIERIEAYVDGATVSRQLGALPPQGSTAERAMIGTLNVLTRARRTLAR